MMTPLEASEEMFAYLAKSTLTENEAYAAAIGLLVLPMAKEGNLSKEKFMAGIEETYDRMEEELKRVELEGIYDRMMKELERDDMEE